MLSKVTSALEEIDDFPGMTVTDVRGFGREKASHARGAPHRVVEDFVTTVRTSVEGNQQPERGMVMRKIKVAAVTLTLLTVVSVTGQTRENGRGVVVDRMVATVNGALITYSDLAA